MIPGLLDSQIALLTDRELAKIIAEVLRWPTARGSSSNYKRQYADFENQLALIVSDIRWSQSQSK